ncbi:MAG: NAD(P)H-dependent oxidoreductase [Bdellovibrionales bacterium]|nr:NAD(P)H-dependent oxidoreductase [Bdellovibrionales bacterium]
MKKQILYIDSSPSRESNSRKLSKVFVETLSVKYPDYKIVRRDLNLSPPPFVDQAWIDNAFLPLDKQDSQVMRVPNEIVNEFKDSEYVVVGMPMYNWGVPAIVKAWIDQIVRAGVTFSMTPEGIVGLCHPEKKVIGLISRNGRFLEGEPYEKANFQDNHFKGIMNFIGVKNVYVEALQDVFNHAEFQNKFNEAIERVKALAQRL